MEFLERERMVADAILLERAAGALDRHKPDHTAVISIRDRHDTATWYLRNKARELRQEAEEV